MRENDRIINAIIVHGPGRSGTTLLNNILALHKELAWISGYVNKFPEYPELSIVNKIQEWHEFEKFNRRMRKFPRPSEPYGFFRYFFKDFGESGFSDLTDDNIDRCKKAIREVLFWHRKKRFITKLTGNARKPYLDALFDNPYVVYIDRDPRAVVMSYYKQRWGYKARPHVFEEKPKEELIREYVDRYLSYYSQKSELKQYPRFIQLYYEDLVKDPIAFFKDLYGKLSLEEYEGLYKMIKSWKIRKTTNRSYKKMLEKSEIELLNRLLQLPLKEMNYI